MDCIKKFNEIISFFELFPDENETTEVNSVQNSLKPGNHCVDGTTESSVVDESKCNVTATQRRIANRMLKVEDIRQKNLDSVTRLAREELLSGDGVASDEQVSVDWILKFMDISGDINDEFLQAVFSKILANEVKSPNSTPLRCLFQIANMSRGDIELFEEFSKYVLINGNDYLIINDSDFYTKCGMRYADLLHLEDCGIFNANGMLSWRHVLFEKLPLFISYGNDSLKIYGKEDGQKLSIQVFSMKETGKAMWPLIKKKIDPRYLEDVQKYLSEKNKDCNIEYVKGRS